MSNQELPIIKEHTYGCSINTPHCPKCGKYCDAIQPKTKRTVLGGFYFHSLAFLCQKDHEWVKATDAEIHILNKFSQTEESWNQSVLKPPFRVGMQEHSDNPFGGASTFYPV